jgi:hypothetical protein
MTNWLTILIVLTTLTSCQRAKDKGEELIDKSVDKAKETAKKAWKTGVDKTFDALTTTEKSSFTKVFKTGDSLNVEDIEGLWIDFPVSFYYCFLKYKADKDIILNYISAQPTKLPIISDETYYKTDTVGMFKNLRFIAKEHPEIKKQLDFFYEIKDKDNLEYYRCNKYPNAHYIIIDAETRTIYHHIESYWD